MSVEIEGRPVSGQRRGEPATESRETPIIIGLVNNMPDSALQSTESQFSALLQAGAGVRDVRLRFSSFPELPRSREAQERVARSYWPLEALLDARPDALIVTGTEPRAARLEDEPYWQRSVDLLAFAQEHTVASIWSCLAAHAAVRNLDGIERQRLPQKRCGVYAHSVLTTHPLMSGVQAPMPMPHSRWNELSPAALRAAGYTLLSWSAETGADTFSREDGSLLLFFQGHPEYEDVTLLKEYRRDVGRYLSAEQSHYPTLPHGYLCAEAAARLAAFAERAHAERNSALLASFPFSAVAATLANTWRGAAVTIYRNWLSFIAASRDRKNRAAEPVSWAQP
jgi:homoserine O-succinyltransferase/O-acetyltransferase